MAQTAPSPGLITVTMGRDDHRPFAGDSEIPELRRLVRFRDNLFEGLEAEDLEDCPRVYVFVHGWVPGSREIADLLYAQEGGVVSAWDERVRNVAGQTMVDSYQPLLAALHQHDPQATVLWFSWVDQSATDVTVLAARESLRNAPVNGRRLAVALAEAIGDGSPQIHLIGHSHGCVVASHAALSMAVLPEQLTLLDCPEDWFSRAGGAAGLLPDLLRRLQPGRGPGSVFVDSYASMFGRAYHDEPGLGDVVDVRLTPARKGDDETSLVSQAHQYPVQWYADTVGNPAAGGGFAWSVLQGFDTQQLAVAYVNPTKYRLVPLPLARPRPDASPDRADGGVDGGATSGATPVALESRIVDAAPIPVQRLTARDPDVLIAWRTAADSIVVEFDYEIARPGKRTRLEAAVDRQVVFVAAGRPKVPARGRYLRVPDSLGGEVVVQFRLREPGLFTSASISNLTVARAPRNPIRNYDDARLLMVVAGLGAAAGAAASLVLVAAGASVRRLWRSPRPPTARS